MMKRPSAGVVRLRHLLTLPRKPFVTVLGFEKYGDLLALSIACDIVPLTGENRVFAKLGLEKLRTNPVKGMI